MRRWALPDRIFFGHGACAILAGVYLRDAPLTGLYAEKITPTGDRFGNHIFVTDGEIAFDHHGYCARARLLAHHRNGWRREDAGWECVVARVEFDLLSTADLNARKMLGPDQYLHDPVARAARFIARIDHQAAARKARGRAATQGVA